MARHINHRGPVMTTTDFDRMFSQISKSALIDALWCACQLGTNDTYEEITIQAARNVEAALRARHDRIPTDITEAAGRVLEGE